MWGLMLQAIEQAKIGDIVPVYKVVEEIDALDYFAKLSDYGRKKNAILLEFNNKVIGSSNPCLKLKGFKDQFEITALNSLGRKFLTFLKDNFKFCGKVQYSQNKVTGTIKQANKNINESQKLKLNGHMNLLRNIAFKFTPTLKPFKPYGGLFGMFSYDFIEEFEELQEKEDDLNEPYYEFYFLDNLFVADNKENKVCLISNALIMDDKKEKTYNECLKTIENYENTIKKKISKIKKYKAKKHDVTADTCEEEFEIITQTIKKNILEGEIYQALPSRTIISNYNAEPFDIYKKLRSSKQPCMFYINTNEGVLFGASPETTLSVEGKEEKTIEVRPIGCITPRGLKGKIDIDTENRYEAELKTNFKEITKHIRVIDSARGDVAKVSKLGTRHLENMFAVEKYSDEQHLVSSVKGILKEDLDALHAYISCMNRAVGYPKITAMKLLRQLEKNKRGYFSGSVCYINPDKDFDSAVIKNAIRLKNKKAYIGVDADVIYDSTADEVFRETEKKANVCLEAIKSAGGLK